MKVNLAPLGTTVAVLLASAATPAVALGDGGGNGNGTSVTCSTPALITALETVNANGGGTLHLARNCDYQLNGPYGGGSNGLPVIAQRITIKGNGATIERTGGGDFRIFEVSAPHGDLTAQDLKISGGRLTTAGQFGAGVYVQRGAGLSLTDSLVSGNTNTAYYGGAIGSLGSTTLTRTAVTDNSAVRGGGLYSSGSLRIGKDSRLNTNHTSQNGGGLYLDGGTASIADSTLNGNTGAFGGAVDNEFADAEFDNCVITNNGAANNGGGLYNDAAVVLRNTRFEGNNALRGGAIANEAWVKGYSVKVKSNEAAMVGGGIYTNFPLEFHDSQISGNTARFQGGGIYNIWNATLHRTTVSGNTVTDASGQGAGIFNRTSIVLDDVRVTGNTATGASSQGGGIYNFSDANSNTGNLFLTKTKVTDNQAGSAGGVWTGKQFNVFSNSAITGNAPTNCIGSSIAPVYHCTN
ncbi:hypothetical protein [Streptomyces sp. NPDC086787]|uniref:hypothetical protein n=1 Tax=Streptomyces sp. NPDC086787 TaxID=3365759 RepID=UPI00380E5E3E